MREKNYFYGLAALAGVAFVCCTQDRMTVPPRHVQERSLSVAEARAFFERSEHNGSVTRSAAFNPIPFLPGAYTPHWERAEASATRRISCVDIPADFENTYKVRRQDNKGRNYEVPASSKLIVVKSTSTDSLSLYLRVSIPDEQYAALYDGNICDMTLNCEDRDDYSGLEYYATTDGFPVAVVRYADGKPLESVYLFDETPEPKMRLRQFFLLLGNMWIIPNEGGSKTRTGNDLCTYDRPPGSRFLGKDGSVYVVLQDRSIIDWIGYLDLLAEAIATGNYTQVGDPSTWPTQIGDRGGGGDGSGKNDEGNSGSTGGFAGPGSGESTGDGGSGNIGGGGSELGGSNDSGNSDTSGDNGGNSDGGTSPGGVYIPFRPTNPSDPRPWNPVSPEIFPPDEPEPKPCFNLDSVRANPLMEMKILGTKVNGIKGGRYGRGRGKMHNGIDLAAPVGTPIYAMFDGLVKYAISKYDPDVEYERYATLYRSDRSANYDAGNRVMIVSQTAKGIITQKYFHLKSVCVEKGQTIHAGKIIGYSGATGSACSRSSAGPHLHLEIYENGQRVNPEKYLYTQFDLNGNPITRDCNK